MKKSLIPIVELVKVQLSQNKMLALVSLPFRKGKTLKRIKPSLALVNGFNFLLENGGRILLEREGTRAYAPIPKAQPVICLDGGGKMLLENGSSIQLEINNQ